MNVVSEVPQARRSALDEAFARRSLTTCEIALGPEHPDVAEAAATLAKVLEEGRRYDEAEALYRRALAIFERTLGPDHYETAVTLGNLSTVRQARGDLDDAAGLYERALVIKERRLGPSHPELAVTLNHLAVLYRAQGRRGAAAEAYRRALGIWSRCLAPTIRASRPAARATHVSPPPARPQTREPERAPSRPGVRYNPAVPDIAGVLFDMGGVVMESPLHAIARYERERGLPANAINRALAATGEAGAWARLERGELTAETFCAPFEAECRAQGVEVDAAAVMAAIATAGVARPIMLEAIHRLRARGLRVGALTNNWRRAGPDDDVIPHRLRDHFDVFIESRAVGLRKPDPRIYLLACRELGVPADRTAFLDDIGGNLKPARALGMTTIKVTAPRQALRDLGVLLNLDLLN